MQPAASWRNIRFHRDAETPPPDDRKWPFHTSTICSIGFEMILHCLLMQEATDDTNTTVDHLAGGASQ